MNYPYQFSVRYGEVRFERPLHPSPAHHSPTGSLFLVSSMMLATALSGCPSEIGPVIIGDGNTQQEVNAR